MGRMVGIDATSHEGGTAAEAWRISDLKAGFGTPLVHGGRVYLIDNSANLHAIDAATGGIETLGHGLVYRIVRGDVPNLETYPFCLETGKLQPTGTLNFSRLTLYFYMVYHFYPSV